MTENTLNIQVGDRVKLNDSFFEEQSGGGGGMVIHLTGDHGAVIQWDNGNQNGYAWRYLEREVPVVLKNESRTFSIKDRVEITTTSPNYDRYIKQSGGSIGTIISIVSRSISIRWDNGHSNVYSEKDIKHVEDETNRPRRFVMKLHFNGRPTKEHVVMAYGEESAREHAEEYVVMHGYSLKSIEFIS